MMNKFNSTRDLVIAWSILILLALVWGSSFILIKKGLEFFTSTEVGALRVSISFLVLSPLALARIRKVTRRDWRYLALVGIIGSVFPAFLFAKAQTGIDSNLAGILNSLTPLFTLLIGTSIFGLKVRWFNIAGILIGLIGAIGLLSVSGGRSFEFNFHYAIYIVIATVLYATNVNIVKYRLRDVDAITITSFSFFIIGLPVILYLMFFTGFFHQITTDHSSLEGLGYIAILGVIGTGLALIAFNMLVKLASPLFAASVTYLIPIVAIFWGVVDGENILAISFLWIVLILGGILLVNKKKITPGKSGS